MPLPEPRLPIDTILVPQGAEYRAICRGLGQRNKRTETPRLLAVPLGVQPLTAYLENWQQSPEFLNKPPAGILLVGLGGSLSPLTDLGELGIYQGCYYVSHPSQARWQDCDRQLTAFLKDSLGPRASLVKGLTSERLIWSAREKKQLGKSYGADIVDMESFAALAVSSKVGIPTAIVRAISDGCQQDLPDLAAAFSPDGSLKPLPLCLAMLQRPAAAAHLIRGSLRGLKALENLMKELFVS